MKALKCPAASVTGSGPVKPLLLARGRIDPSDGIFLAERASGVGHIRPASLLCGVGVDSGFHLEERARSFRLPGQRLCRAVCRRVVGVVLTEGHTHVGFCLTLRTTASVL